MEAIREAVAAAHPLLFLYPMNPSKQTVERIRGTTRKNRNARIFRREPLCRPCRAAGRVTVATQVDHIVALANGGTEHDSNLQPICEDCNELKGIRERGHTPKDSELKGLDWIE